MNPKRLKLKFSLLFILLLLPLSGCWDMVDLDQRTAVIGMGLDIASASPVRVTAQIPISAASPIQLGEQPHTKSFHTIATLGQTMLEATHNLEDKAEKRLFWGQLKIVMVTTALAKKNLKPLDILQKQLNIPPISWIALYDATSPDILSVNLGSTLPAISMDTSMQLKSDLNEVEPVRLWSFLEKFASKTTSAYLPVINFDPEEHTYRITRIGVFRHSRLVGILSEDETRMAGFLMGKTSFATTMIPLDQNGAKIFFHRITSQAKITMDGSQPASFLIRVKATGFDPERNKVHLNRDGKDLKRITRSTTRLLQKEMTQVSHHLQQLNSDILGLGETYRLSRPERWNPRDWEKLYPLAKVRIQVQFTIQESSKYR